MASHVGDLRHEAAHFTEHGWAMLPLLDGGEIAELQQWVAEVESWDDEGGWFNHYEMTDGGPRRCRTENFTPFHAGLRDLLTGPRMLRIAEALMGEPVVLYKEKINYKLAGGAGWNPHQDAPAYPFIEVHVSCMVAVDDASTENGCLEVVDGAHHDAIPTDSRGCIPADIASTMSWTPVPVPAGSTLWFHSLLPHRSGDNRSSSDRRALYPTYNARREGDLRARYYEHRRRQLSGVREDDRAVISLIDDFRGRPVA